MSLSLSLSLASTINIFFIDKIDKIRTEFPLLEVDLPPFSFVDMDSIMPVCTASLDHFDIVTVEELTRIISCMNKTTCKSDPFPTKLLFSHLPSIISVKCSDLNKEGTPRLVDTRGSCRRFSIFEK